MNKNYLFYAPKMHCNSCEIAIESELIKDRSVIKVNAKLKNKTVEVEGNFNNLSAFQIQERLNKALTNYKLTMEKPEPVLIKLELYKKPLAYSILIFTLYIFLQQLGLEKIININGINLIWVFVIGIIASVSTCMAIVGGILLSISASVAKNNSKKTPVISFFVGRFLSFFILGGAITKIGTNLSYGDFGNFINIIIYIVLIYIGLGILDLVPKIRFFPKSLVKTNTTNYGTIPAFILGALTFFMPCGFTQSMQVYSLGLNHFLSGALTMLVFALGTFPVLGILGFGIFKNRFNFSSNNIVFKVYGFIIIFLGIHNIYFLIK